MSDRVGETAADGTSAMTELMEARQARAERDGLHERRVVVGRLIADAETQLRQAQDRQRLEQADVIKLESLSLTRILTGLKGNRDTELQRERAEAEAAAYEVGVARARLDGIRADLDAVDHRLAALVDVDRRWEHAVAVRADELTASGDPVGARLDELGETIGARSAELAQIGEAAMAAQAALTQLGETQQLLGSAQSWSTYDTFFDGGFVADMVKYNRLDQAAAMMRATDAALTHLAGELADVGIGSVGQLGISEMTRAFDVWFDNIFSDWSVRNRIVEARQRVDQMASGVADVAGELDRRAERARTAISTARAERERLVGNPAPGAAS